MWLREDPNDAIEFTSTHSCHTKSCAQQLRCASCYSYLYDIRRQSFASIAAFKKPNAKLGLLHGKPQVTKQSQHNIQCMSDAKLPPCVRRSTRSPIECTAKNRTNTHLPATSHPTPRFCRARPFQPATAHGQATLGNQGTAPR